jgi:hypothetical protein
MNFFSNNEYRNFYKELIYEFFQKKLHWPRANPEYPTARVSTISCTNSERQTPVCKKKKHFSAERQTPVCSKEHKTAKTDYPSATYRISWRRSSREGPKKHAPRKHTSQRRSVANTEASASANTKHHNDQIKSEARFRKATLKPSVVMQWAR